MMAVAELLPIQLRSMNREIADLKAELRDREKIVNLSRAYAKEYSAWSITRAICYTTKMAKLSGKLCKLHGV